MNDGNLYSILFTVCEVAFDNFFIKEFYDDDDDGMSYTLHLQCIAALTRELETAGCMWLVAVCPSVSF